MTKIFLSVSLCLAVFGSMAYAQCKEPNGTLPVSGSCDAYIECKNGVAEEKLCPDGLLYNEKSTGYPCGYPIDVECTQSARLQSAQATDECPHQFGYYAMGDASHCGQFKNCASGRGFILECPEGLAWNKDTYQCDWPDLVADCDAESFLGFKCPEPAPKSDLLGEQENPFEYHASSTNCQEFFVCIEGRPRRSGCGEDRAFNPETNSCDDIENVSTCGPDVLARVQDIKAARAAAYQARKSART